LDYDDGHYEGGGIHLGAVIVPALLAALPDAPPAQDPPVNELLAALAAGYEVGARAGWLLAPRAPGDPYHTSGAAGAMGAAAAVARLLGLDAAGCLAALRIASAHAPIAGLQLPMVKEAIGWGAATGLAAAQLAAAGFGGGFGAVSGAQDPAEAPLGIAPTPFDGPHGRAPFALGWGQAWHSLNAYIKPWPCCRAIHTAIAGVEELLARAGAPATAIERIEVEVPAGCAGLSFLPPASMDHAQFSLPFVLGCLMVHGAVRPAHFLGAGLADPAVLAAAARVHLRADPALAPLSSATSYPARVALTIGGAVWRLAVDHAPGSRARPLGRAAVAAKLAEAAALAGLPADAIPAPGRLPRRADLFALFPPPTEMNL
ncbi:MAG TPA: MmgE/PrpD family protein, partial [Novosphingobium sp.]|nr:MmgE/PrpD family protein [Novosphingobium sp.]